MIRIAMIGAGSVVFERALLTDILSLDALRDSTIALHDIDPERLDTANLMAHFYRNLEQDGLSPAAALRAAQMAVRKESKWRAPYYWAGFQLQGEWR